MTMPGFLTAVVPDTATYRNDERMLLVSDHCPARPDSIACNPLPCIHSELRRFSQFNFFVLIPLSDLTGQAEPE
jgi:hypothetical protein